jgi:signal transduction histidine kinase
MIGAELASDPSAVDPPAVDLVVEGASRDLKPVVRDEAYRIAREALRNAFQHARARRVTVEIRCDRRHFVLRVRDDGRGMDERTIQRQRSAGHFGLLGMRERADMVGGRFKVRSRLGAGTEVELRMPGATAYTAGPRRAWRPQRLGDDAAL